MHQSEQNRIKKVLRLLAWAEHDMAQAHAAATCLEGTQDLSLSLALETAISVCYARPFKLSAEVGQLPEDGEWVPLVIGTPEQFGLHCYLIHLRDKRYAHLDKPSASGYDIEDTGALLGEAPNETFGRSWEPMPPAWLPPIMELCESQGARFSERALKCRAELKGDSS